jgi:hypothetical protein
MRSYLRRISTFGLALLGSAATVELAGIPTAQAASWTLYSPTGLSKVEVPTLSGLPSGTAISPVTFVPTLIMIGSHSNLFITFLSTYTSGSNYQVYQYNGWTNTESAWSPTADFYALSQDAEWYGGGYPWGIGAANYLWQSEGSSTFTNTWPGATSVASNNPTAAGTSSGWLLATNDASTQNVTGYPHGQTIKCFVASGTWPSGTWTATSYGAAQVCADGDSHTNKAYAIGTSGVVWSLSPSGSGGTSCSISSGTSLGNTDCTSGNPITFYQIAAKDGPFAMDSSGTVWIHGTTCWNKVATQTFTAATISTDNSPYYSAVLVWAQDTGGNIWYAQ